MSLRGQNGEWQQRMGTGNPLPTRGRGLRYPLGLPSFQIGITTPAAHYVALHQKVRR